MVSACDALEDRWLNGLSARVGVLCAQVREKRCTQAELDEYRAYLTHARLVGFLTEQMADDAAEWVTAAERHLRDCTMQSASP